MSFPLKACWSTQLGFWDGAGLADLRCRAGEFNQPMSGCFFVRYGLC